MDCVLNYLSLAYMTRSWSYEGLSLVRALHEARYFWNVTTDVKLQKQLLVDTVEAILAENATRAETSR